MLSLPFRSSSSIGKTIFKVTAALLLTLATSVAATSPRGGTIKVSSSAGGCSEFWFRDGVKVCGSPTIFQRSAIGRAPPATEVPAPKSKERPIKADEVSTEREELHVKASPGSSSSYQPLSSVSGVSQKERGQSEDVGDTVVRERVQGPADLPSHSGDPGTTGSVNKRATEQGQQRSESENQNRGSGGDEGRSQGETVASQQAMRDDGRGIARPQPRTTVSEPDQGNTGGSATHGLEKEEFIESSTQEWRSAAYKRHTLALSAVLSFMYF